MAGKIFRVFIFALFALGAGPAIAQSDAPPNEAGVHFSLIRFREFERTEPGIGGRYTYNFNSSFGIDSEITFFPKESFDPARGELFGGRKIELLFGPKVGLRGEKFGAFGKIRPGLMRFGKIFRTVRECAFIEPTPLPEDCFEGENRFALDVGGIVEYYPTARSIVRFDVGDTIIHTRSKAIVFPAFTLDIPSRTDHNFQFNVGVGFRF